MSPKKRRHTRLEIATRSLQHASINEDSLRRVDPPGLARVSGECKDFRVDKIPIHDGIPYRFLHCEGRQE